MPGKKPETELLQPAIEVRHRWPVNMTDDDLIEFKEQSAYHTFDGYLRMIKNAWVSPDSVVYQNGFLIKETLANQDHISYYKWKHLLKKFVTGKKIRLDDSKKYLLVTDLYSIGHFHWFVDVLPKLISIEGKTRDFILLLPDVPYIRTIGVESLRLAGLEFADIIFMKQDEFFKAHKLYYISRISVSGHMNAELMNRIREKFTNTYQDTGKRIYISRNKAAFRKLVNEQEIISILEKYKYEVFYGEDLSLEEQVKIFSSCESLIGVHGAGLTNCIFMKPGTRLIELRRKENGPHNVGYWHLADAMDLDYYYLNGTPDSDKTFVGQGCNLFVSPEELEINILKKIHPEYS